MLAGYGINEITPPLGVELAGYGYYLKRQAVSVMDRLYARSVALRCGDDMSLIVSCDLLGLSDDVCQAVFGRLAPLGFEKDNIMIVSVHTHTGPVVKDHEGCGVPDEGYISTLAEKIAVSAERAKEDLADVESMTYHAFDPGAFVTASPVEGGKKKHGFAVPGVGSGYTYNRAIQDGPVDRVIRGILIRRAGKKDIALSNAACHAVFSGILPDISADYPGQVNRLVDAQGRLSVFVNGLCGDIDPAEKSLTARDRFAETVASVFEKEGRPLPLTVKAGAIPYTLRVALMPPEERHRVVADAVQRQGGPDAKAARPALVWEENMKKNEASLSDSEALSCRYSVVGGVPIVAVPFEGYTAIGQRIRAATGRDDLMALGCLEEMRGYLPTMDDIQKGGYAALESTFLYRRLPVVSGEAERLGDELGRALKRILTEA